MLRFLFSVFGLVSRQCHNISTIQQLASAPHQKEKGDRFIFLLQEKNMGSKLHNSFTVNHPHISPTPLIDV